MPNLPLCLPVSLLAALLLGGCATRFDIGAAEHRITPQQAANNIGLVQNKTIAWGGIIVAAKNLASQTQLEVLSYPLDGNGRPDREAKAGGRFIALHSGYLELANAEGRFLADGRGQETRAGSVGESRYVYPVLAVKSLFLWPTPEEEANKPQFHFGVGVGIGL
jgi:outer membrane lipoprotein